MSEKLPLEILREKYLPIRVFPEIYGIEIHVITDLIDRHKIKYAEFKAPGDTRRTVHVNYEEVLSALGMEDIE